MRVLERLQSVGLARWLPALAIGAMQMAHLRAGALTDYGADFFGPIAIDASMRANGSIVLWFSKTPPSAALAALITLTGCVLCEFCQLSDFARTPLAITRGHFDPCDLAAYALGVLVAFCSERAYVRATRGDVVGRFEQWSGGRLGRRALIAALAGGQ